MYIYIHSFKETSEKRNYELEGGVRRGKWEVWSREREERNIVIVIIL